MSYYVLNADIVSYAFMVNKIYNINPTYWILDSYPVPRAELAWVYPYFRP